MFKRGLFSLIAIMVLAFPGMACTSAIIGPKASASGRPILWKHRDTSNTDNKVEYVAPANGAYGYVALFNASDVALREAWMGMNEVGFAVMNTASYNIKDDKVSAKKMDKEGILMTKALKTCRTVDDFAALLDSYPRPMGVEANFGVIDAYGNGAYFETNNHSYVKYPLDETENDILIRTNYSHSGRKNEGYGFIREANAEHLICPVLASGEKISPEYLTETVSRSFYHDMKKRDMASGEEQWLVDQDFIPRYKSTATIAIEGCVPMKEGAGAVDLSEEYIMWTGLGYPPCAEIRAVRCSPEGVDADLRGLEKSGHSRLADKAKKMRDEVFPLKKGNGDKYIDIKKLYNKEETGYVQQLRKLNLATYQREKARRDKR